MEANNQVNILDLSSINNMEYHYLCTKCLKFPYINFCKDKKFIRITCSCFNNKKILIKDYFKTHIENIIYKSFLISNNNKDIEEELLCKLHKKKFQGFSKIYCYNYCQSCIDDKDDNDIIRFDNIKIGDTKIEYLLKIINNIKSIEEYNIFYRFKNINDEDGYFKILSEEDEIYFNNLIKIIINDYKNYPNFLHFFNIKNILYFFNIEHKPIEILNNKIIKINEPIIIEYNNNISNKTKLFNKTFVKNNKNKCKIEIEGEILDLL